MRFTAAKHFTSLAARHRHKLPQPARRLAKAMLALLGNGQPGYGVSLLSGNDESLDVPIESLARRTTRQSLCVVAHVFYTDLVYELMYFLGNIPGPFDVSISTCSDADKEEIDLAFQGWDRGGVTVAVAPNKGRDISHKLITHRHVYDRYEFVLFVHTKKSPHESYLAPWRRFLLLNLVGSRAIAQTNLGLLRRDPNLGMIGSQHFEPIRHWVMWAGSFPSAQKLAARMGVGLHEDRLLDFPSGSMFWARTAALRPLLDMNLTFADFEPEEGQTEGTLAHTIERMFFHACEKAGFSWIKVARPELLAAVPSYSRPAVSQALDRYLQEKRRRKML
jgi:lipopolysaccharide biosynthesis protein